MEGLLDILSNAASQNPEKVKVVEQQLKALETQAGFYSALMVVILNRSLDSNVRWLASVCLKNGVNRYWGNTCPNSIPNEEKIALKQNLLLCFDEPENIIASQIALTIPEVAKIDWPSEWSELFPTLLSVIQRPEEVYQQRGILVLHHVLKPMLHLEEHRAVLKAILNSEKVGADNFFYEQVTVSMFPITLELWENWSSVFIQEVKNTQGDHMALLEKCFFCLKVLEPLLIYSFKNPAEDINTMDFVRKIFEQFKPFLELRKYFMANWNLLELHDKYLVRLVKILTKLLENHPAAFNLVIQPALECIVLFCFSEEYKGALSDRFTVSLFNLMTLFLQNSKRRRGAFRRRNKFELVNAEPFCQQFFTPPVVTEIIKHLVYRYITLPETDINDWKEFPEELVFHQLSDTPKYNIQTSAKELFQQLFCKYEDMIYPIVLDMIESFPNLESTDYGSILRKEASLTVIYLCYNLFYGRYNFEKFLMDVIIPESQNTSPDYILVKRSIFSLLGILLCNFSDSSEHGTTFIRILLRGMDSSESIAVRLAAVHNFRFIMVYGNYQKEYAPLMYNAFTSMYHILKEIQEGEIKMSVLSVLSDTLCNVGKEATLSEVGKEVSNFVELLINYMLELWQNSGEQYRLHATIISCFTGIVNILGELSCTLYPVLMQMIHASTDPCHPSYMYVVEDAIHLWQSVIENTPDCTRDLLLLVQNLLPLMVCEQERWYRIVDILKAYLILAPQEFIERYGENIVKAFMNLPRDISDDKKISFWKFVHIGLVAAPNQCALIFQPLLASTVTTVLEDKASTVSRVLENETCDKVEVKPSDILLSCLYALSRVALIDLNCFVNILQMVSSHYSQNLDTMLEYLVKIWLNSMQFLKIKRRKLCCMALLYLLTKDLQIILHYFSGILLATVEVLSELDKCDSVSDMALDIDSLDLEKDEDLYHRMSPHKKRKAMMKKRDPLNTVNLKLFLKSHISYLESKLGPEKFKDLMSTVDAETMQHLYTHLQM